MALTWYAHSRADGSESLPLLIWKQPTESWWGDATVPKAGLAGRQTGSLPSPARLLEILS